MDWDMGNPNKTAALIAMLMVGIWSIAYVHRMGFWIALVPFTASGVCLIHTISRGGLVALAFGLTPLVATMSRPWSSYKVFALIGCVLLLLGASVYLRTYPRYEQGIEEQDPSINNRLLIWEAAPRMMVDAPDGWGLGNSGRAYMQWYQPLDRQEVYRTLVSSHVTWLVEFGWPLRFVYLAGWFAILMLCWPNRRGSMRAVALGVWITLLVAGSFSSVAESVWIWIIPVLSLVIVIADRWSQSQWPNKNLWILCGTASIAILITLSALGSVTPKVAIRGSSNRVLMGRDDPKVWVVINPQDNGVNYGRTLRKDLPPCTVVLATSLKAVRGLKGGEIVIFGAPLETKSREIEGILSHFNQIVLVNPTCYPNKKAIHDQLRMRVIFGEFSQSPSISAWTKIMGKAVSRLSGVGDFIPQWTGLLGYPPKMNSR